MTFALAQFRLRGATDVRSRLGAVIDSRLVDLTAVDAHLTDLSALIAGGDKGLAHARQAATSAAEVDQAGVEWLPPIGKPGKIICLGLNYAAHAAEGGNKAAEYPSFFMRTASGLIGHRAPLIRPPVSEQLDFEAELAVVVGRRARHLSVADALTAVAGYACFNDGTIRDYQRKTSQWTIGKNFDGTGAFGPWFVPAAELPAGAKGLKIESRLNGQVMQSDDTANMIVPVAETLQLLTEVMTLEPGDVIIMGTPAGVGYARKPPVWMKPGDTIEIDIEGIGVLSNPIVDEVK